MLQSVLRGIVNWQIKKTEQCFKVSSPCLDAHHFKIEELESLGELPKVCSQFVLKFLHLARLGRPDFVWSVHKLVRAVIKWTRACDRHLARLISYNHWTSDYRQYCHVGNTAKQCRLGLFQDSGIAGDVEDSTSTSRNLLSFRKSIICSHTLDVQETKRQYLTVHQNHKLFHWMLVYEWTVSMLLTCGMWWSKCYTRRITYHQLQRSLHTKKTRRSRVKLQAQCPQHQVAERRWPKRWPVVKSRSRGHKHKILSSMKHSSTSLKTTKQWSRLSSKVDVQWWDTCPAPQSRDRLVVWQNQLEHQDPNDICWLKKTNSQTCWLKEAFTVDEWCNLRRPFNIMNFSMFAAMFVQLKR